MTGIYAANKKMSTLLFDYKLQHRYILTKLIYAYLLSVFKSTIDDLIEQNQKRIYLYIIIILTDTIVTAIEWHDSRCLVVSYRCMTRVPGCHTNCQHNVLGSTVMQQCLSTHHQSQHALRHSQESPPLNHHTQRVSHKWSEIYLGTG